MEETTEERAKRIADQLGLWTDKAIPTVENDDSEDPRIEFKREHNGQWWTFENMLPEAESEPLPLVWASEFEGRGRTKRF